MRLFLLAVLVLAACRDLSLPPAPGMGAPGTVFGRAVYSPPGASQPQPAAGTLVTLGASSIRVTAGTDGRFDVEGLASTGGTLIFQFDSDGDGTFDRQRTVSLEAVGAGPGRNINLGDVVVGESAHVHGLVLRGDLRGISGGHLGTQVFVPQTPFVTYSAADGRYQLDGIPAGPVSLGYFRPGYLPAELDGLTLQPGEDFAAAEVDLARDDGTQTGSISGTVSYQPVPGTMGAAALSATNVSTGVATTAMSDATTGAFTFSALPAGLYDVRGTRDGYTAALVPNVLVFPMQATALALAFGQGGSESDGGRPPAPDAGPSIACAQTADCGPGQWCDGNLCAPLCSSTVLCGGGRVCDPTSHTCVTPCTSTCPTGQTCDPAARVCRTVCGDALPCPNGFKCSANACVPACVLDSDCPSVHQTCTGGSCVPNGTCATDLDCLETQLCATPLCAPRQAPDGGWDAGWPCKSACECRLGETCTYGVCTADLVPTLVLDGGALDVALASAQPGAVIALKAGDTYVANDGFTLGKANVTLSGGYVACRGGFIFDSTQSTTLTSDGGTVLRVAGSSASPLDGVMLRGLTLVANAYPTGTPYDAVSVTYAPNARLFWLQGGLFGTSPGVSVDHAVFHVVDSPNVDVQSVSLLPAPLTAQLDGLWLQRSDGNISGFSAPAFSGTATYYGLRIEAQTGPVHADSLSIAASGPSATSVYALQCNTQPLEITDSVIGFSMTVGASFTQCAALDLHDLFIDGSKSNLSMNDFGIQAQQSAGSIKRTRVLIPATTATVSAFSLAGAGASGPWTLEDLTVDGCGSTGTAHGVDLASSGSVTLTRLNIGGADAGVIGPSCAMTGLYASIGNNDISLTDSTLNTPYPLTSSPAIDITKSNLLIERSVITGGVALKSFNANVEAYASFFYAHGDGAMTFNSGGQLYAVGSTLDGQGDVGSSYGLECNGGTVGVLRSCLVNGGQGFTHYVLYDNGSGGGCFVPANHDHNYYYFTSTQGGLSPIDGVHTVLDGGSNVNGNVYGQATGCYPQSAMNPGYRLSAGSPCVDMGAVTPRKDGTMIPYDIDGPGHPRVNGPAPDIGAYEL
jgi:hypothetical protein